VAAYGSTDELNAVVGLVRAFAARAPAEPHVVTRLDAMLRQVQNDLFNVGSDLATPPGGAWSGMHRVKDDEVARLEKWIDELNEELEPLREFVLPGGGPVGAFFHQARTVCRRAERDVVALMRQDPEVDGAPLRFLNRLSDWFFVAGRWAAMKLGEPEFLWDRPGPGAG
jgi:cob(I)alamin adenosyltransferase